MKVLVTGANGFLGAHLCKKLLEEGLTVLAMVRKNSDIQEFKSFEKNKIQGKSDEKFKIVNADVTKPLELSALMALERPSAVFHLAGYIGYKKSERNLMDLINVTGTKNVIDAMKINKVKKIVHLSSVVAVGAGFSSNEILDENSVYNLETLDLGYFETKRLAEKMILSETKSGNIESVILNPSTIYGSADAKKSSRKTQLKVAQGKFKFYTSGGVSVVSVEDVIEGIFQGYLKGRNGERYILSGENITIKELFRKIADFANVEPPNILLPNWVLHSLGFLGDELSKVGIKGLVSRENAWTSTLFHWFKNDKASNEFGIKFKNADYSISQSVEWMKQNQLI